MAERKVPYLLSSDPIVGAEKGAGRLAKDKFKRHSLVKGGDPAYLAVTLILPLMGEEGAADNE